MNIAQRLFATIISLAAIAGCGPQRNSSHLTAVATDPFWPTEKPGDSALDTRHSLYPYFLAAKAKRLPANYFRDLIGSGTRVTLRRAEWPSFQPIGSGGTLSHPRIGDAPSQWTRGDWSTFYNELFHAWWNGVFTRSSTYAADRARLFTADNDRHYRQAHRSNPRLAQEEAYSETIGTLMIYLYPTYNPANGGQGYFDLSHYQYNRGRTVEAVGHSDRGGGYTPAAETTYPSPAEYAIVFRQLLDTTPPGA